MNQETLVRDVTIGDLHLTDHPGMYSGESFVDLIHLEKSQGMLAVGSKGRRKTIPLSTSDFDSMDRERRERIKLNLSNFARHKVEQFVKAIIGDDVTHPGYYLLWTAKNRFRSMLEEKLRYKQVPNADGLEKEIFVAHNIRATND